MNIIVDFITKLDKETSYFRDNLTRNLAKIDGLNVIAANSRDKVKIQSSVVVKTLPRRFKWKKLRKELELLKPDAIVLFTKPGEEITKNFNCYYYLESTLQDQKQLKNSSRKMRKLLNEVKNCRRIIVRTEFLRVYLQNHFNIDQEKFVVIGQGYDNQFNKNKRGEDIRTLRRVLSMYRVSMPYIFLFGDLEQNPYVEKALEAFASIHQKYPDLKVLLFSPEFKIGWDNKPQPLNARANQVLQLCENLKINRKIVFAGEIDRKHFPVIISNALCAVYLADEKLFPAVLLEVMASASPMIISDTPIFKEITKGSALVVTPKVADSISDAISLLISDEKELNRLRERVSLRSNFYTWDAIAERFAIKLKTDAKFKQKKDLLIIRGRYADKERQEKLNEALTSFYDVMAPKRIRFRDISKNYHNIYFIGPGNFLDGIKLILIKLFNKQAHFIVEVPEKFFTEQRKKSFFVKLLFKIRTVLLGFYLKRIFKRFVIDNTLLITNLKKDFKISNNIDHICYIYDKRFNTVDASKLREEEKLKNYVCVTVRLQSADEIKEIYKMAEYLYSKTKSFKFLIIEDEQIKGSQIKSNSIAPKILKKISFFKNERTDEVLLNSRIYLDMREKIPQEDILAAMKTKNLCITRKTLTSEFLIKQGIHGYIYSSLETDKIFKQIETLIHNRVHLEDIRRVNKQTAISFNKKNVTQKLSEIIKDW